MESFGNPDRFAQISRRVSRIKPILAVKGRRGRPIEAGSASHTAGAFRSDAGIDALFRQAGVMPVSGTQELFDAAAMLGSQPLPRGRRVAVLTNSGGLGTVAGDALVTRGLRLAELAPATLDALLAALPAADRTGNPIDMGILAGAPEYEAALGVLLADEGVDAAVALFVDVSGRAPDQVVGALAGEAARHAKPVVASVLGRTAGWPTSAAPCPTTASRRRARASSRSPPTAGLARAAARAVPGARGHRRGCRPRAHRPPPGRPRARMGGAVAGPHAPGHPRDRGARRGRLPRPRRRGGPPPPRSAAPSR
jgi:acyl-CoA synthetase (NDP forming)